jgi:hypothetical protein
MSFLSGCGTMGGGLSLSGGDQSVIANFDANLSQATAVFTAAGDKIDAQCSSGIQTWLDSLSGVKGASVQINTPGGDFAEAVVVINGVSGGIPDQFFLDCGPAWMKHQSKIIALLAGIGIKIG